MLVKHKPLIVILTLLALVYVHTRAALLAFTYDECWSFMGYARWLVIDALANTYPAANNHVFHSLLMKGSWLLFGQVEYFLRLPVLIAHMGYLLITYKLLKAFAPKYLIPAFILLNFQPYLLDYFVAARGYGIAIFLIVWALYSLLKFYKKPSVGLLLRVILLSGIAAWTNFTYLLLFITFIFLAFISIARLNKMDKVKSGWKMLLVILPFIALIGFPLYEVNEANELYFGGQSGFFVDTLPTLSKQMLYGLTEKAGFIWIYPIISILSLLIAIGLGIKNIQLKNIQKAFTLLIPAAVVILPAIGSVLLHYLFGKPYLVDRTALFLLPLSLIQLVLLLNYLSESQRIKSSIIGLQWGFASLTLILFITSINFTHLIDFKEHSDTRQALLDLQNISKTEQTEVFTLGKSTFMNATMNFYRLKYDLSFMNNADLTFCNDNGPYPYYYVFGVDKACVNELPVELIKHYPVSDTYLYRYKTKP